LARDGDDAAGGALGGMGGWGVSGSWWFGRDGGAWMGLATGGRREWHRGRTKPGPR